MTDSQPSTLLYTISHSIPLLGEFFNFRVDFLVNRPVRYARDSFFASELIHACEVRWMMSLVLKKKLIIADTKTLMRTAVCANNPFFIFHLFAFSVEEIRKKLQKEGRNNTLTYPDR